MLNKFKVAIYRRVVRDRLLTSGVRWALSSKAELSLTSLTLSDTQTHRQHGYRSNWQPPVSLPFSLSITFASLFQFKFKKIVFEKFVKHFYKKIHCVLWSHFANATSHLFTFPFYCWMCKNFISDSSFTIKIFLTCSTFYKF